jgi:prepilin-type N-terminal cleavage/methylation domain-containing protein
MASVPTRTRRRRGPAGRAGFTLAEVLVSAVILAIGFISLVAAFGHDSVVAQRGEDLTFATFLADEIRDMALQMSFADVLALDGTTYDPAVLSTGGGQDLEKWSQIVAVTPLAAGDLNTPVAQADADAARVTVEIRARGTPVLAQTYHVLDLEGVPFVDE